MGLEAISEQFGVGSVKAQIQPCSAPLTLGGMNLMDRLNFKICAPVNF